MIIDSGGVRPNSALVSKEGELLTKSSTISQQTTEAIRGHCFNIFTGTLTLTNATETPVIYLKNDTEEDSLIISRVFFTFGTSTGGAGEAYGSIYRNITGGTIQSDTNLALHNLNFGSGHEIGVVCKVGTTGTTFTGGEKSLDFLLPTNPARELISIDSIVLPRGSSATVTFKPPVGNTSMKIQVGFNLYIGTPEDL